VAQQDIPAFTELTYDYGWTQKRSEQESGEVSTLPRCVVTSTATMIYDGGWSQKRSEQPVEVRAACAGACCALCSALHDALYSAVMYTQHSTVRQLPQILRVHEQMQVRLSILERGFSNRTSTLLCDLVKHELLAMPTAGAAAAAGR
jgi:hypothetical protein